MDESSISDVFSEGWNWLTNPTPDDGLRVRADSEVPTWPEYFASYVVSDYPSSMNFFSNALKKYGSRVFGLPTYLYEWEETIPQNKNHKENDMFSPKSGMRPVNMTAPDVKTKPKGTYVVQSRDGNFYARRGKKNIAQWMPNENGGGRWFTGIQHNYNPSVQRRWNRGKPGPWNKGVAQQGSPGPYSGPVPKAFAVPTRGGSGFRSGRGKRKTTPKDSTSFTVDRCYIGNIIYTTTGNTTLTINNGVGNIDNNGQWYFNPQSRNYLTDRPAVVQSAYWTRYRLRKLCFEFTTRTTTNADTGVVYGFEPDPTYFSRLSTVANSATTPTKDELLRMHYSGTFNSWVPKTCLNVPYTRGWLYVANGDGPTGSLSFADGAATQRQSYAAAVGFRCEGTLPAADTVVANVFVSYIVDLRGMVNVQSRILPSLASEDEKVQKLKSEVEALRAALLARDEKDEKSYVRLDLGTRRLFDDDIPRTTEKKSHSHK